MKGCAGDLDSSDSDGDRKINGAIGPECPPYRGPFARTTPFTCTAGLGSARIDDSCAFYAPSLWVH